MSFWDETVTRAKEVFSVAEKKTEEAIAVQKLKIEASSIRSKLDAKYKALGELIYSANKKEEEPDATTFSGYVEEIDAFKQEYNTIQKKIAQIKGKKICKKCGAKCLEDACFCNKCGQEL